MSDAADTTPHVTGAPLAGRSVVITRPLAQARALAEPLAAFGAEVLAMPVLDIVDPPDVGPIDTAIGRLRSYDWVVLTSANAVDRFFARLVFVDQSGDALRGVKLAAVGTSTAGRMREKGVQPDLVPESARAEGLVAAFSALGVGEGCRVLIPRALTAREMLPEALRARGVHVDVAPVYRAVPIEADPVVLERLRAGSVDAVTFTSGAIARAFVGALGAAGLDPRAALGGLVVASVGPVTTADLEALGVRVDLEAPRATMASLAETLAAHFAEA